MIEHPNLIHFFGFTKMKEKRSDPWPKYCLILELIDNSLYDVLHNQKVKLKLIDKYNISLDIAHAMKYLHQLIVIHNVNTFL